MPASTSPPATSRASSSATPSSSAASSRSRALLALPDVLWTPAARDECRRLLAAERARALRRCADQAVPFRVYALRLDELERLAAACERRVVVRPRAP